MSLATRVSDLAERIAEEFVSVRAEMGPSGPLVATPDGTGGLIINAPEESGILEADGTGGLIITM